MQGHRTSKRSAILRASFIGGVGFFSCALQSASAQNLLLDPGFEPGVSGAPTANGDAANNLGGPWSGWCDWAGGFAFYTNSVARTGTQCGKTYSNNGGVDQFVAVTPGECYTSSGYFDDRAADAISGGASEAIHLGFYTGPNGTGSLIFDVNSPAFTGGADGVWTQESVSAVAPPNAQSARWLAYYYNPAYAGGALYVDDASLSDTSWNGAGTDNNWSDASNWDGVAPGAYSPVVFSSATRTTANNDLPNATPFYGISFSATAGAFMLTGNGANLAADLVNNSSHTQTIALNLGLQQDTNFNTAAGSVNISGGISGAFSVVKQGSFTLTLSGSNTYTGATNVTAGSLVIASPAALPAGNDLLIASGASVIASNQGTRYALQVGSLNLGGKLDLNNNALVIHNTSVSNASTVSTMLASGFNHGAWNGSTGIVSSTAAGDTRHLTAVGVITNDNGSGTPLYGTNGTIASTFAGATPADGDLLVRYTYYGDADLSGVVNSADYARIDAGFLGKLTGWWNGDFNYDNVINGSDYTLIDNAFNTQGAALTSEIASPTAQIAAGPTATSAVPEPSIAMLAGLATLGLLARRKRAFVSRDALGGRKENLSSHFIDRLAIDIGGGSERRQPCALSIVGP